MVNTYKIREDKIGQYLLKKALGFAGTMILSCVLLALFFGIVGGDISVSFKLIWGLKLGILGIASVGFVMALLMGSPSRATRYEITPSSIRRYLEHSEVGAFSQYSLNKAERKSGQKQSELIFHDEIASINLNRDKIVIKSKQYSMMNHNGRIDLPCEMEEYETIKEEMQSLKKRLRF